MKDKIEPQPNNSHTDDDVLDLNNAITGAISSAQQPSDVSLNEKTYEQLNSQAQQRVDSAINMLISIQSDFANLLIHDVFHATANGEEICTGVLATQAGAAIDNYNAVVSAIRDLKRVHKSK